MAEMLKDFLEMHKQHEQQVHRRMHEYDKMIVSLFAAGILLVMITIFASVRHGRTMIAIAVIAGGLLIYGAVLLIRRKIYKGRPLS